MSETPPGDRSSPSSRRQNTGSLSKRGMQHHTILALASMSAPKLQLPMTARSSELNAAPRPGHHRSTAAARNGRLPHRPDEGGPHSPLPHCRHGSKRSEEHTSELQSLMRISYAVFC